MTIFMNKSDCTGQGSLMSRDCYCYGNPDYLICQTVRENDIQFNGTITCKNCGVTITLFGVNIVASSW